jgi:hypothetical protein
MSSNLSRFADSHAVSANSLPASGRSSKWSHDDPTELLEHLGDEYTQAAFEAVLERSRSGQEVAHETEMSKATAFRRLNTLVELDLVETERRVDASDGHHYKRYRAVVESFSVTFDEHGFHVVVESAEGVDSRRSPPRAAPADD